MAGKLVLKKAFIFIAAMTLLSCGGKTVEIETGPKGIKPNSYTKPEMDKQVNDFYRYWKARYLRRVEDVEQSQKFVYYSRDVWSPAEMHVSGIKDSFAITVSEAHGYGMLILACMGREDPEAQADFDAMYRFFRSHPTKASPDLMSWRQYLVVAGIDERFRDYDPGDDGDARRAKNDYLDTLQFLEVKDDGHKQGKVDSATDGDMDIAYALLAADAVWGSSGSIDYRAEGIKVIKALMDQCVDQKSWTLKLGNWQKGSGSFRSGTRPSDFMPQHIETFAKFDTGNSGNWLKVKAKIIELCNSVYKGLSKDTGLMPDFMASYDGGKTFEAARGKLLETDNDGDYSYNSCRTPWRLSMDYLVNGYKDLLPQLASINRFIQSVANGSVRTGWGQTWNGIPAGFYVANRRHGEILGKYDDLCFTAPFALAAATDPASQEWLNQLWEAIAVPTDDWSSFVNWEEPMSNYYGNSINMLVLISLTERWVVP